MAEARTDGAARAEPSLLGLCRVATEEDKVKEVAKQRVGSVQFRAKCCRENVEETAEKTAKSYTNPTSCTLSYTQSYTRYCQQILKIWGIGVGNVGDFQKTFFMEESMRTLRLIAGNAHRPKMKPELRLGTCVQKRSKHTGDARSSGLFSLIIPSRDGRRQSHQLFLRNDFRGIGAHRAADVP